MARGNWLARPLQLMIFQCVHTGNPRSFLASQVPQRSRPARFPLWRSRLNGILLLSMPNAPSQLHLLSAPSDRSSLAKNAVRMCRLRSCVGSIRTAVSPRQNYIFICNSMTLHQPHIRKADADAFLRAFILRITALPLSGTGLALNLSPLLVLLVQTCEVLQTGSSYRLCTYNSYWWSAVAL